MQENKTSKVIGITLVIVLLVASLLAFLIPPLFTKKYDETLVIYNWADYMDLSVIDDFEAYYEELTGKSIEVVYTTFDTNETMLTEIIRGDSNIDIICPSEYAIQKLLESQAIQKLDTSLITASGEKSYLGNIDSDIRSRIENVFGSVGEEKANMNDYFAPYMWGTLGLLFNTKYVTLEEVKSNGWSTLWNSLEKPELNGKILAKDSIRDIYICALGYLKEQNRLPSKYDTMPVEKLVSCTDKELVDLVETVLKEQKPHLKGYEVDFGKDDMIMEEAYVDLAWSGDALYAIEESMDDDGNTFLEYYAPESVGNIWFDGWVMPKNAKNTKAGMLFINYLCRPDIAMRNTMEIGYSMAIDTDCYKEGSGMFDADYSPEAVDYMLEVYEVDAEDSEAVDEFFVEFFEDDRRYPDMTNANLGMMQDFGESVDDTVEMWERVKASTEDTNWINLVIIIAVMLGVGGVIIGLITYKLKKNPKPRKIS